MFKHNEQRKFGRAQGQWEVFGFGHKLCALEHYLFEKKTAFVLEKQIGDMFV